jgi:hypothetical protein
MMTPEEWAMGGPFKVLPSGQWATVERTAPWVSRIHVGPPGEAWFEDTW